MIFGKTDKEKFEENQKITQRMLNGQYHFAFIPVKLHSGEWIWLEHYWVFWQGYVNEYHNYCISNIKPRRFLSIGEANQCGYGKVKA